MPGFEINLAGVLVFVVGTCGREGQGIFHKIFGPWDSDTTVIGGDATLVDQRNSALGVLGGAWEWLLLNPLAII